MTRTRIYCVRLPDYPLVVAACGTPVEFGAVIPPWLGTWSQAITRTVTGNEREVSDFESNDNRLSLFYWSLGWPMLSVPTKALVIYRTDCSCAPDLLTLIVTVIRVHSILTESRLGDVSSDVVAGKAIGNNDPGRSYIYYAENPECSSFPNVHLH